MSVLLTGQPSGTAVRRRSSSDVTEPADSMRRGGVAAERDRANLLTEIRHREHKDGSERSSERKMKCVPLQQGFMGCFDVVYL